MIDESQIFINLTKNVPNLQCWFTNTNHFECLPLDINTTKNLDCEIIGEKLKPKKGTEVIYSDLIGLMPLKDEYLDTFDDFMLNGKMVFYENGFIFVDNKLNAIVLPYEYLKKMTFHQTTEETWM